MLALPDVDLEGEVDAIIERIRRTWAPTDGVRELVRDICDHAQVCARAWVADYVIYRVVGDLRRHRLELLRDVLPTEAERALARHYDVPCLVLDSIAYLTPELRLCGLAMDGEWRYERAAHRLYHTLEKRHPMVGLIRPVHGEALGGRGASGRCQTVAGHLTEQSPDSGAVPDFAARSNVSCLMRDDHCRTRSPGGVLVCALFSQLLRLVEWKNTHAVCQALTAVDWHLQEPALVFEQEVTVSQPLALALLAMAQRRMEHLRDARGGLTTAEAYRQALAAVDGMAKQPYKERATTLRELVRGVADINDGTLGLTAAVAARDLELNTVCRAVLREHLGCRDEAH